MVNIGFISTRFAGTDGVTLETDKWWDVLSKDYQCFFFAGELDENHKKYGVEVPKAFFKHPEILSLQERLFQQEERDYFLNQKIKQLSNELKTELYNFVREFDIDLLIPQNALTIPMNVPLGLATTELIFETGAPTVAHHHDFYWERDRFDEHCIEDLLTKAFPANLPTIEHVVINSFAQKKLQDDLGIESTIIPNVQDFENPPRLLDISSEDYKKYTNMIKYVLGLRADEIMFLQPTRIVPRKGIETSIDLVKKLQNPKAKLVITHQNGDEGNGYSTLIERYARENNVDVRFVNGMLVKPFDLPNGERRALTLDDAYHASDFVTFPSIYEGYGNAFPETIYFKRPLLINRHPIYQKDIEELGFKTVATTNRDGKPAEVKMDQVHMVKEIFKSQDKRDEMVHPNYVICEDNLSYKVLEQKLPALIQSAIDKSIQYQQQRYGFIPFIKPHKQILRAA